MISLRSLYICSVHVVPNAHDAGSLSVQATKGFFLGRERYGLTKYGQTTPQVTQLVSSARYFTSARIPENCWYNLHAAGMHARAT